MRRSSSRRSRSQCREATLVCNGERLQVMWRAADWTDTSPSLCLDRGPAKPYPRRQRTGATCRARDASQRSCCQIADPLRRVGRGQVDSDRRCSGDDALIRLAAATRRQERLRLARAPEPRQPTQRSNQNGAPSGTARIVTNQPPTKCAQPLKLSRLICRDLPHLSHVEPSRLERPPWRPPLRR